MIYFIEAVGVGNVKIGFTDGESAESRLACLQTGSPVPLRLLGTIPGTLEDEKNLHRQFAAHRVAGEWFKPVGELVAMIPTADLRNCEGIEIVERPVSIRVLTVGRKQFTKALLTQLPHRELVDWDEVVSSLVETGQDARKIDFPLLLGVDVWGWLKTDSTDTRALIFESEGRLMKSWDYKTLKGFVRTHGEQEEQSEHGRLTYRKRDQKRIGVATSVFFAKQEHKGFRPEDQLFFGI